MGKMMVADDDLRQGRGFDLFQEGGGLDQESVR